MARHSRRPGGKDMAPDICDYELGFAGRFWNIITRVLDDVAFPQAFTANHLILDGSEIGKAHGASP
jgi:hypothetical protein